MRAMVYRNYGSPDVVTMAEVPKPVPREHEVLVRIHATTVTTGDWRARSLHMPAGFGPLARLFFGIFGPRKPILGTELAGEIAAVGNAVTRFAVGDAVIAFTGSSYGCHAEYRTISEDALVVRKPENLGFEEAASLSFGGLNALGFLRDKARIKRGDRVLVVGASGGVGAAAIQIAKHFGAEVTGVCSTTNADLVRSLGAARVIDYTRQDFADSHDAWDIIFDTTGTASFARCARALKRGGRLVAVQGSLAQAFGLERGSRASDKKVIAGVVAMKVDDMRFLARLAEAGELRPVIDRRYPLSRAAEAHAYVDTGRKRGSVVLNCAPIGELRSDHDRRSRPSG